MSSKTIFGSCIQSKCRFYAFPSLIITFGLFQHKSSEHHSSYISQVALAISLIFMNSCLTQFFCKTCSCQINHIVELYDQLIQKLKLLERAYFYLLNYVSCIFSFNNFRLVTQSLRCEILIQSQGLRSQRSSCGTTIIEVKSILWQDEISFCMALQ